MNSEEQLKDDMAILQPVFRRYGNQRAREVLNEFWKRVKLRHTEMRIPRFVISEVLTEMLKELE